MKTLLAALALVPSLAFAQIQVTTQIKIPDIHFEVQPPLVVVEPGVQVVTDYGEDLYVVDGFYWVHRDGHWFRSGDHRGHWVVVEPRYVPVAVYRLPPGKYKHWKGGKWKKAEAAPVRYAPAPAFRGGGDRRETTAAMARATARASTDPRRG